MLFLLSTTALGIALHSHDLMTVELGSLSAMAVIPAAVGMVAGQSIRKRLSEEKFRLVFFIGIAMLGAYIIIKSVLG